MPYPESGLYPSATTYPGFAPVDHEVTAMYVATRLLRLAVNVQPPSGQGFRWAADEPKAQNVLNGLSFTTSAPGGFETCSLTLPRRPRLGYPDLELMSNVSVTGAGGQVAWEGRIEGVPRTSGNEAAVSPNIVGWQAHLEDDTSAKVIYVDRDLSNWGETSRDRRVNSYTASRAITASTSVNPDVATGIPAVVITHDRAVANQYGEAMYLSLGSAIGNLYYDVTSQGIGANWVSQVEIHTDDSYASGYDAGTSHAGAVTTTATVSATTSTRKCIVIFMGYSGATFDLPGYTYWRRLTVWGDHGITKRGTAPDDGVYASDVIAHALGYAPRIRYTTGTGGSITPSTFIIPQLAFREPTTASEIISAANRYHLRDYFIWEGARPGEPTFYYHARGERGRAWRARVGPSQLAETGTSIERAWNGVIVRYNDVDGTTKTVGPTGATTDSTSDELLDDDPLNPLNRAGIRRWQTIDMSGVSTVAGATEIGRRFLVEAKAYDTSGQAQIVGHCEDDRGVERPAWQIRAGDTITFTDAADTSPRRVIKTNYSDDNKTNSVDLDAPPDALAALLERLQVELVPYGL